MNAQELKTFETRIAELFKDKKIRCPIHLSSGNEEQLIHIFNSILSRDYVFSTHRNHLHYLLHTGDKEGLEKKILGGDSMHTC
jgi:pyruvate dehydrogenase E1 component alpha subunit